MEIRHCARCILPTNFPGIIFTDQGICQFCADDQDNLDFAAIRKEAESTVGALLGKAPTYDIALAFSGGKDSTYTLIYLAEQFPDARIVVITVDNDFISEGAWGNCRKVPAALGVDHIILRPNPQAMREVYRTSINADLHGTAALKRASAICNSCIQIINTQILNFATNYDIPVVVGGYIGGQVPSHSGIMEQRLAITARMREGFLERLSSHLKLETIRLFEQRVGKRGVFTIVNPMIFLNPSEEEILERISLLGWEKPEDTGKSSTNCLLNDYAIYEHLKHCGYHPYVFELATMVRKGILDREEALRKIDIEFTDEEFDTVRNKLGLE